MIEVVLPLENESIEEIAVKGSNSTNRSFVIFGEDLPVYIISDEPISEVFHSLLLVLNDSRVELDITSDLLLRQKETVWRLDFEHIQDRIFDSEYLLNNSGQQGKILIECNYRRHLNNQYKAADEEADDILPSFELLNFSNVSTAASKHPQSDNLETYSISLPVYSLMNMRLRNVSLRTARNSTVSKVISSLDVQLARRFGELYPNEKFVTVDSLTYELCDGRFRFPIQPMETMIKFPLRLRRNDAYTINYRLQDSSRLVKVTIKYNVASHYKICTSWKTEVCLGKLSPSKSMITSTSSTPTFFQAPKMQLPRVLSLVQFNFLEPKICIRKGEPFTATLQVENTTNRTLNLVIYHRPKSAQAETVVLLSNDLKLPLLYPNTTFQCDLEMIALAKGYHHNMKGIKVFDLDASDAVDLGSSLSVFVQ